MNYWDENKPYDLHEVATLIFATKIRVPIILFSRMNSSNQQKNTYIGFVSNSAWYMYIHRWDVISYLIEQGYHILIIAPKDRPVPAFEHPNVEFVPLWFSNTNQSFLDVFSLYKNLKAVYRTYRPACIFHFAIKANIIGSFAAKALGIPCVSIISGTGYSFLKKNKLYYTVRFLYRRALKWPREVWFLNDEDAALFTQEKMAAPHQVRIQNGEGINLEFYNPANWPQAKYKPIPVFICATRFLYSKGIGDIAAAIQMLKSKNYDFTCLLIGEADSKNLDAIPATTIEDWRKKGIFELIPYTDDVRPWLAKSQCFLMPSYSEGLSRSLMEAASMELPIITTRQKGCKEAVIEGVSGFLCNMKDPKDLSEKMETFLNMTDAARLEMGKAGRQLMKEKFQVQNICKEYLRILQNMKKAK